MIIKNKSVIALTITQEPSYNGSLSKIHYMTKNMAIQPPIWRSIMYEKEA